MGFPGSPASVKLVVYWKIAATGVVYRLSPAQYTVTGSTADNLYLVNVGAVGTAPLVANGGNIAVGDQFWVKSNPAGAVTASDPLDLTISRPSGAVAWLEELRGLLLGAVRGERVFSAGPLAIDPVTGQDFELTKYSTHGSDKNVPCLAVQDKIIFVNPGRKRVRSMGQSITTNGGLVADDISTLGEHLLAAGVRTMCYLRAPVSRIVFGFDDGTGAIATLDSKMNLSWCRFTLPSPYDIYSVSATDTDFGTELYVSTSTGDTLVMLDVDSKVAPHKWSTINPPSYTYPQYDPWKIPMVMDAWREVPLPAAGTDRLYGFSSVWVGKPVGIFLNGSLLKVDTVFDDGGGGYYINGLAAYSANWSAPNGPSVERAGSVIVGLIYSEHRFTTLPLNDVHANPVGDSQNLTSRKPQLHLRFVDSYMPLVNGKRIGDRLPTDVLDLPGSRVTGDRRATELGFQQGAVIDVVMDLPLRMEVSAVFGGAVMNNI
jgi:hypothetical protein